MKQPPRTPQPSRTAVSTTKTLLFVCLVGRPSGQEVSLRVATSLLTNFFVTTNQFSARSRVGHQWNAPLCIPFIIGFISSCIDHQPPLPCIQARGNNITCIQVARGIDQVVVRCWLPLCLRSSLGALKTEEMPIAPGPFHSHSRISGTDRGLLNLVHINLGTRFCSRPSSRGWNYYREFDKARRSSRPLHRGGCTHYID